MQLINVGVSIYNIKVHRVWNILHSTLKRAQTLYARWDVSRILRKSSTRICDLPKEPPQRGREGEEYILPRRILRWSKKSSKDCMEDRGRERGREKEMGKLWKTNPGLH